ncbi:MAG TPA: MMPL family transporter [Opitutaceae bacterium]|nr:MMPL family transporter [Opitutaceae bacterium]
MEPPRQKWIARIVLLAGAIAGLSCLGRLNLDRRISTDILDLVPEDERSPELSMVRNLAGQQEARIILLALRVGARPGESAGDRARRSDHSAALFAAALASAPAIAQVMPLSDPRPREALAAEIYSQRLDLLLPGWLEERRREFDAAAPAATWSAWLAEKTAADLEAYLSRPEAMATQDILTSDPLLLVPGLAARMSGVSDSGPAAGRSGQFALVWARTRDSPLAAGGQGPVFEAVDRAFARLRDAEPGTDLQWTGIARFAAASRARIERELGTLNLLSLVCVLAVVAACVRRFHRAIHLAPVVLGSLLGAWVATIASWQRVHVLVFVVGSLLAGVAVDYGFYLCLQPRLRPDEPFLERASRLMRPLLASALTTVIGFSFLLWSVLPLIRQLGVFVSAGLVCALATALLWFAQVDDSYIETRAFVRRRHSGSGALPRRAARILLAAGAAVALVGPWRLQWKDDIRELEIPTPELKTNDASVRALFGETPDRTVYLTRGSTPSEARASLQAFLAWHEREHPNVRTATLGYAVPTQEQWDRTPGWLGSLGDFERDLRAALARHGFRPDSFTAFFDAWSARIGRREPPAYGELVGRLAKALQGPLSSLLHVGPGMSWFATVAEDAVDAEPPAGTNTVSDSQLQNLNRLFSRYRLSALRLSSVGLAFVGASVFVLYGLRRGIRIFAIPAGACLFAFGLFGLMGETLNLFHLLGAFLGVCLSHNYAIFSAESLGRAEEPPPSIRMSAVAAASSFGVLALSRIPVVAALGSTVAVIVLAALAITELVPLASGAKPPGGRPPP